MSEKDAVDRLDILDCNHEGACTYSISSDDRLGLVELLSLVAL
jgi:hypothetical protein